MKLIIETAVRKALKELKLPQVKFSVEHPENMAWGDFSTNVGIITHKPQEILAKLKTNKELGEIASKIEVAGAGFINISIQTESLITQTNKVLKWKFETKWSKKKVIVEFSSPNIAKPFTIGHLRSTIIGAAIANILEAVGAQVLRDNHLGDWGTQFGKQIWALKRWGGIDKKQEFSVKELVALYVKFHDEAEKNPELDQEARDWFKKLETGNQEAKELWQKCVDWSWVEFQKIYDRLGIKFSDEFENGRGLGESFFEAKMPAVIKELKQKQLLKIGGDGAQLVFFPKDKYPPAMILKKDGTSLYATRDLATDKFRKEKYKPNLVINEVGEEQRLYFKQLFEIEKMLGWYREGQRIHVWHGHFRFKDQKMSTRKGNVIWLEDVLDEAEKRAMVLQKTERDFRDKAMNLARDVGIGALKWNDLKGSPDRSIVFDWDEILKMEGNSGPYLQYTYARARSVLQNSKNRTYRLTDVKKLNISSEESMILRTLYRFEEVVVAAADELAPNLVATFIFDLAQKFNSFYNKHRIIGSGASEPFRLWLTQATAEMIKRGLNLLGINAPEKM